ncbi:MAG TPA: winged helix-turn-helix domain-containing protein [Thermodesulfobacteriota bacterium]|nr:winged helix-turn-helix domain-containing protein [Thermodesulfobacteriota bacterium]
MKDRIGEIAGKIWTALGERQNVDILKLPKMLKEKAEIVYQALGWLAREDKINYHTKDRKTFVSLSHGEREIFENPLRSLPEQGSRKDS